VPDDVKQRLPFSIRCSHYQMQQSRRNLLEDGSLKKRARVVPLRCALISVLLFCLQAAPARAQSESALGQRIRKVISRPEFAHANFGIEFYSLDTGKVLYALNADKLFVPASTTKILTEGTLLAKLGADYRFHTCVYRTGAIDKHGTLKGDLILVASGDPNLSNRIQPDGTLAFVDHDHSYNGPALPGDPLVVIKQLARDAFAKGIRKIAGHVYVDATLLPEAGREGGTNVVMSSIMVNDDVIDLLAKPGAKPGDPVQIHVSPQTGWIEFVNKLTTSAPGSNLKLDASQPVTLPSGLITVTLEGAIPVGSEPQTLAFPVPSPAIFAGVAFKQALIAAGIPVKYQEQLSTAPMVDFALYQRFYTPENQVAEHVSPPLSEEIKVTLKVSQNLHAGMGPYLLGRLVARDAIDPLHAGFGVERSFLTEAKLDLSGAAQGDGAGGDWADLFSPDFMVHYLTYWTTRPPGSWQRWHARENSNLFPRRGSRLRKNRNVRFRRQARRQDDAQRERPRGLRPHQRREETCLRRLRQSHLTPS
jgi:PBP4 family serine-type D-alanyl-D-alanine carboxypeptidase